MLLLQQSGKYCNCKHALKMMLSELLISAMKWFMCSAVISSMPGALFAFIADKAAEISSSVKDGAVLFVASRSIFSESSIAWEVSRVI